MYFKGAKKVEMALLDSGATENFLDYQMVQKLKIKMTKLPQPRRVFNIDGTENKAGNISTICTMPVTYAGKQMKQVFYVSDLGEDRAILGYPFLYDFNPKPDWKKGKLPDSYDVIIHNDSRSETRAKLELIRRQKEAIRAVRQPKNGEAIFMRRTTFATT